MKVSYYASNFGSVTSIDRGTARPQKFTSGIKARKSDYVSVREAELLALIDGHIARLREEREMQAQIAAFEADQCRS